MLLNILSERAAALSDWSEALYPSPFFLSDLDFSRGNDNRLPKWFDLAILARCLARLEDFIDLLASYGRFNPARIPALFLQRGCSGEDRKAAGELKTYFLDRGLLEDQDLGSYLPFSRYVHTRIFWGCLEEKGKRLTINPRGHLVGLHDPFLPGKMLGYRLVNELPAAFEVSDRTMTENMVRMILHDLLHCILPPINSSLEPSIEPYHDVLTLGVMWDEQSRTYCSKWDRIVSLEATDPLFCTYGGKLLKEIRAASVGLHAQDMLQRFRQWHPSKPGRYLELFPFLGGVDRLTARANLAAWTLSQVEAGFPVYIG